MGLPPRLRNEQPPDAGEIVVCAYCERLGVAARGVPFSRLATRVDIVDAERAALDTLRDQAHDLFPKKRRRPLLARVAAVR